MKKLYKTYKYRKSEVKRAQKKHMRNLRHKEWRKRRNQQPYKIVQQKSEIEKFKDDGYHVIKAPKEFSFVDNTEEVSAFIQQIKLCYLKRRKVFVDMLGIEKLEYSALVVLLSIMVRFKADKIPFNGSAPKNQGARAKLIKSKFFEHLYNKNITEQDKYSIVNDFGSGIYTYANKKVDSSLTAKLIKVASKALWGDGRVSKGCQRVLIELMQNTNNHAEFYKQGVKQWWLSVSFNKEKNIIAFSFIDFGVGVFESLNNKPKGNKWYNYKEAFAKVGKFFNSENNNELMECILKGQLHSTVTGKPFRGKGLPGIKLVQDRNQISNLCIITNDVYANVSNESYNTLLTPFSGTYVYWELNVNNV